MKNQILKIAGVKNEKEFYQKFPTEEAFMAKHGGEFKKAQQGKTLPPKIVSDKNDPRYKAYQDSLTLYNNSMKSLEKMNNLNITGEDFTKFGESIYPSTLKAYKNLKNPLPIKSESKLKPYSKKDKTESVVYTNVFKKPEQPYILEDRQKLNPIQNNLQSKDLVKNNINISAEDFKYIPQVKPTKGYKVHEEHGNGNITDYEVQDVNNINTDMNRKQTITPVYKKGGIIKDNEGYRNPNNQGHPVSIDQSAPQSYIDMKGINQSLLALDDNEIRLMHPEEQHRFKGNKVIEFPIAQNGANMNVGQQPYQQYNPYFTDNPGIQNTPFPKPPMVDDFETPNIAGQSFQGNDQILANQQITEDNQFAQPSQQSGDFLSAITTGLPIVGQVLSGITGLGAEKEKRKAAKQMKMVSDVSLMASNTRPEQVERRYNRPEDNVFSQQEMYPTYGTGTNPLAKNGKKLTKAQLGASLTSMIPGLLGGNSPSGNTAGDIGGGIANAITGNNAGGMIGGGLGSLFGPGGRIGGTLLGGFLDKNPNRTKRYEQATDRNMQTMAANSQIQGLQSNNSSHMQDGGNMNMNGDLETHWGGEAQPISYNPHLPDGGETVMFRGNSHSQSDGRGNSGIGITYGDNPVEVEAGEPAVALPDSQGNTNLTVFGNLSIPKQFAEIIGDDKAKGKKFKNYIADLSKKEAKHSSLLDKSSQELNSLDMTTPYDKLKFQTLQANILGSNMALKDIADKKTKAAELQSIINNTAEQHGLSAEHLVKGKIKQVKNGTNIPKAQFGYNVFKNIATTPGKLDFNTQQQSGNPIFMGANYEKQWMPKVFKVLDNPAQLDRLISYFENYNGQDAGDVKEAISKGKTKEEKKEIIKHLTTDRKIGPYHTLNTFNTAFDSIDDGLTPIEYKKATDKQTDTTNKANFDIKKYKRSLPMDIYNQILPYIRPTDQEGLDANQLLGEMNAFATNQLQPVDAQTYQPLLQTPYDISYQDVLNENNADFKSLLKQSNPATQSLLAAQKYQANSKVLGEQFRANQQEKSQVYSGNRNTLNDAQLKNLNIFDTQYTRQAQALSNTKAINQSAINSMSSKYQQNKLENRKLGIMENLYNYRFDAAGRAQNFNPLFQANEQQIYSPDSTQPITHVPVKDSKGNTIEYRQVEPQSVSPTLQSPQNYQPILTTAQTTTEYYQPIQPGPGVDTSVGTTARKGKTMSKKYTNGSIVSSLKKY